MSLRRGCQYCKSLRVRICTGDSNANDQSMPACVLGLIGYLSQSGFQTEISPIKNLLTYKHRHAL